MRKPFIFLASAAALISTGAASAAEMTNLQFLEAARCRGLAASEGLGKVDTSSIDKLLSGELASREMAVRSSAARKIKAATEAGNKADGAAREKLLAERASVCSQYLGAPAQVASN